MAARSSALEVAGGSDAAVAAQQENAAEIARRGGALYDKFCGFVGDLEKVGAALGEGQKQYENALRKLSTGQGNLVRKTEELRRLGAKASKSLPLPLLEHAREGQPVLDAD